MSSAEFPFGNCCAPANRNVRPPSKYSEYSSVGLPRFASLATFPNENFLILFVVLAAVNHGRDNTLFVTVFSHENSHEMNCQERNHEI